MTNDQNAFETVHSDFGLRHSFGIRHSGFVILFQRQRRGLIPSLGHRPRIVMVMMNER
jgi:hypothetical protein